MPRLAATKTDESPLTHTHTHTHTLNDSLDSHIVCLPSPTLSLFLAGPLRPQLFQWGPLSLSCYRHYCTHTHSFSYTHQRLHFTDDVYTDADMLDFRWNHSCFCSFGCYSCQLWSHRTRKSHCFDLGMQGNCYNKVQQGKKKWRDNQKGCKHARSSKSLEGEMKRECSQNVSDNPSLQLQEVR